MKQQQFTDHQRPTWDSLATLIEQAGEPARRRDNDALAELPALYRRVCADYALARHRRYSTGLVEELHDLVQRGHRVLYQRKSIWLWRLIMFLWAGFPNAVRRHWRAFALASALFYVPAFVVGIACYFNADFIYSVMDADSVAGMEHMYDPSNPKLGRTEERSDDSNFMMFGFYIQNNIGIGFRTFAGGIVAGIGTVLVLLFNGVVIGGVAGHLTQLGFTETFWPFVAGHSAFELTAICISGAAGLLLGKAVIAPGRRKRSEALKVAGLEAVNLVVGAAFMLLAAAFVEAFWSPNQAVSHGVKYLVSATLWLLLILYLAFAGRNIRAD
ncbi:stage II sporulation protein M [Thiosocius teredinicola]|uniref:stage II sporulation protein M n=1 Tax=Thiosocius teredinicola TaxID=1973002 RepID=UPI000990BB52